MSDGDWSVQSGRTSFGLNFKNRFGTVKLRFSNLRWLPNAAGRLIFRAAINPAEH
jgi:hypothetical protein